MTAGGSDNFVVKAPNRDGQRRLEKGQSVTLGWRTKDCRALDPTVSWSTSVKQAVPGNRPSH